jgi:hypothetical protein
MAFFVDISHLSVRLSKNRFIMTPSIASNIVITGAEILGYIFINILVGNDLGGE